MPRSTKLKSLKRRSVVVHKVDVGATNSVYWIEPHSKTRIVRSMPTALKVLRRSDNSVFALNKKLRGEANGHFVKTYYSGDQEE